MDTVTRIVHTRNGHPGSEEEMPAAQAVVALARDIAAAQARDVAPRVRVRGGGNVTLTWANGDKITYLTGVDTSVPIARA